MVVALVVAALVVAVIIILGLLYLDRALLLADAEKLEAEVVAEIEKIIEKIEVGAQADVLASLNKLKAKL